MPEWLQWLTAILGSLGLGTAVATWIRTRPAMKKLELEGEAALWAEIRALKEELAAERRSCDERIGRLEERHVAAMADLRAEHAVAIAEVRKELSGEVSILRHERNNMKTAWLFLITSIKKINHPELQEIAAEAEKMLKRGDELIALEKGAMKA